MLKFFLSFKYPQAIWSTKISEILVKNDVLNRIHHIYDAPGGAGWVSNNMKKAIDKKYIVIDTDVSKIKFAKKYIQSKDIYCEKNSLYDIKFRKNSLWMLVNSFYLLSDIPQLLEREKDNIEYVIGVFPYTNSKNYTYFLEEINSEMNVNAKTKSETILFFGQYGYQMIDTCDTIRFNFLCYSKNIIIRCLLDTCFLFLEKLFKLEGKNYWVGLFQKTHKS